jgi:phosphoenolpyruvate carboxykinase (ATP)
MAPDAFDALHADMLEHMKGGEYFVQDLYGGADPSIASTCAWSPSWPGTTCSSATCCAAPSASELDSFTPEFTIINCPSFKADPNGTAAGPTR